MSNNKINITEDIMSKIKSGEIKMKSRWYFMLGSTFAVIGSTFLLITLVFLVNLTIFSLRTHGPMGDLRYEQIVSNFPWWVPIIAIIGISFGVWILKKFDFSYKKNFSLIIIGFISTIIIAGFLVDNMGFNSLMERGPMRGLYQKNNIRGIRGQGWVNINSNIN